MARQQHKSDYSLRSRSHQPPPRDDGDVEQLVVWEQPRKTGGTSSSSDPTEGGNSVEVSDKGLLDSDKPGVGRHDQRARCLKRAKHGTAGANYKYIGL